MLNIYRLGSCECDGFFEKLSKRAGSPDPKIVETVNSILADVKARGDEAVLEYTDFRNEKFAVIHPAGAVGKRLNNK